MSEPLNVLVITGNRRSIGNQRKFLRTCIAYADLVLVGDAEGVDSAAEAMCLDCKLPFDKYHAGWGRGKADGPARNGRMAVAAACWRERGARVRCFAFPDEDSYGTWDCVRQLEDIGFQVVVREVHHDS